MATFIKAGFWDKLCQPCKGYKGWLNLDELIQSFIPKPTYKVYTALLTQSGGDNSLGNCSEDPQPLIIGVTYTIADADGTADFTNVGAPNNEIGTFFVAMGTIPNSWGTSGENCLYYNTGAPVVTVLENTIGNIWFTYISQGKYAVKSLNLFVTNKTYSTLQANLLDSTYGAFYTINRSSESNINIYTDGPYSGEINNMLNNTPIEIRVYN
jgi:hypothetical protein